MHVNRARFTRIVVAPHLVEELLTGIHATRILDEERQQLEGLRLKVHHGAVAQYPLPLKVNLRLGNAETRTHRCRALPSGGTAKHCTDACDQLA